MYGTPTIGQPIGGPLVSAVGTLINLPPPHMPYGVRVPVPGSVVPRAPMGMAPLTYQMSHTSAHRIISCLLLVHKENLQGLAMYNTGILLTLPFIASFKILIGDLIIHIDIQQLERTSTVCVGDT